MNSWNVEKVIDMSELFKDTTTFNEDISGWNISNVILMDGMFRNSTSFNQNLCAWKDNFDLLYGFEGSAEIFDESGCTYTERPRRSNDFGGPFCPIYSPFSSVHIRATGSRYTSSSLNRVLSSISMRFSATRAFKIR